MVNEAIATRNEGESTMKTKRHWFYVATLGLLSASATLLAPGVSRALDEEDATDDDAAFFAPLARQQAQRLRLSDLAGSWAISIGGNTGCGISSMYVTVELDASGRGTAHIRGSSTGCPPGENPGQSFQILSLNADGSGTAGLSCGPACGWLFTIQVPQGNTNLFTVVDVAPENPNNVLVGTAARKWR